MQQPQLLTFYTNIALMLPIFIVRQKKHTPPTADLGQAYLGLLCLYQLASF